MSDEIQFNEQSLEASKKAINNSGENFSTMISSMGTFLTGLDKRLYDHFDSLYNIKRVRQGLNYYAGVPDSLSSWINDTYGGYGDARDAAEDIANDLEYTGPTASEISLREDDSATSVIAGLAQEHEEGDPVKIFSEISTMDDLGDIKIDPEKFKDLPDELQQAIKDLLKEAGYGDEEIEDIINGEKTIEGARLEKVLDGLEELANTNSDIEALLREKYGTDYMLGLASAILGADMAHKIFKKPDLSGLSEDDIAAIKKALIDRGYSEERAEEIISGKVSYNGIELNENYALLEDALKKYPELGKWLNEKYGITIVNDDGSINADNFQFTYFLDHASGEDDLDFRALLSQYEKEHPIVNGVVNTTTAGSTPTDGTTSTGNNPNGVNNVTTNNNNGDVEVLTDSNTAGAGNNVSNSMNNVSNSIDGIAGAASDSDDEDGLVGSLADSLTVINGTSSGGAIVPIASGTNQSSFAAGPIIAALAVGGGGAAAGVTGKVIKDKKEKADEEEELEAEYETEEDEAKPEADGAIKPSKDDDDKEWLYGLGIGLSAAAIGAKIAKDKHDKNKEDEDLADL